MYDIHFVLFFILSKSIWMLLLLFFQQIEELTTKNKITDLDSHITWIFFFSIECVSFLFISLVCLCRRIYVDPAKAYVDRSNNKNAIILHQKNLKKFENPYSFGSSSRWWISNQLNLYLDSSPMQTTCPTISIKTKTKKKESKTN